MTTANESWDLTADEARTKLRGEHICTLRNVAAGRDVFGDRIERPDEVAATAAEQVERREEAQGLVHSVLRSQGLSYGGTSGWHMTAYVTPDQTLGLVDIGHGVAVEARGVTIPPEVIEAATAPDQPDGCLASGAAAWTAPDAGVADLVDHGNGMMAVEDTGRRPSAPAGWRQLLVDVRGGEDVEPAESADLRLHTIGLQTCYGETAPPRRGVDQWSTEAWHDTAWWPYGPQGLDRIAQMREDWLASECRRLDPAWDGERVGIYPDQFAHRGSLDGESARANSRQWWCAEAARWVSGKHLRKSGVLAVQTAGRDSEDRHDHCTTRAAYYALRGLLVHRIWAALLPICESLESVLGEWPAEYDCKKPYRYSGVDRIQAALNGPAEQIAKAITEGLANRAATRLRYCLDVLYEAGPVRLDQPVRSSNVR